ncbi:hypothetical protein AVEN_216640-1 [Araneus ventricosus]|uniref:Uncharacterized protein n=1 Tax=Araneus ventricosus TaxID=182803 RepID=A0A4Y2DW31_ARAVE|nr:hypothetical protein AVEN_216640-1 [Araneus ventricosus]
MYAPEGHTVQPPTAAAPEVRSIEPSAATTPQPSTTTTAAPQPSTTTTDASQPSTAPKVPSTRPLTTPEVLSAQFRRDQRRTYKTVGSWELGGGIKASVVQTDDGGTFINIRLFTPQNRPIFEGVCMSIATWDYFSEQLL